MLREERLPVGQEFEKTEGLRGAEQEHRRCAYERREFEHRQVRASGADGGFGTSIMWGSEGRVAVGVQSVP